MKKLEIGIFLKCKYRGYKPRVCFRKKSKVCFRNKNGSMIKLPEGIYQIISFYNPNNYKNIVGFHSLYKTFILHNEDYGCFAITSSELEYCLEYSIFKTILEKI